MFAAQARKDPFEMFFALTLFSAIPSFIGVHFMRSSSFGDIIHKFNKTIQEHLKSILTHHKYELETKIRNKAQKTKLKLDEDFYKNVQDEQKTITDELDKLIEMKNNGYISESEFTNLKSKLTSE